ncbi:hypothetical protein DIURU_004718 [Diutina rugosa]|uniref:Ubiquitin-activating enzyme E1-like n=1 Tax=Diutina rugosa TaxID=5481 RepID=A0A642UG87_DIURU|nr:uncharacterized protein DIURU_004718 [Diutina rugosa]KAA8898338.1 hypothetical protein DIURU_004718 [Diutina rugosa]
MARDSYVKRILGEDCVATLRNSKVLMVGAGGIGCELIKDLVLLGYGEVHIVDLDTITLSNLNRQFLFRQKDIDKSKATTISQSVQSFNYHNSKLKPHHGNIMDTTQFPMSWWQQFDYVFNALDNIEARRYVNKMCLFLKTPLMESGTEGYDGHVQPIFPYATECFDCDVKETPTTYPVCTIRSTPSQPVHCITWAKEFLWPSLFGEDHEEDLSEATDNQQELSALKQGNNELQVLKEHRLSADFFEKMVNTLYTTDIEQLLRIDALWKERKRPTPLVFADYTEEIANSTQDVITDDTSMWSVGQNLYVLSQATASIQNRIQEGETIIAFDKDDEDTLNFVAAAANLRSFVFGIPLKTKFDIKEIAGNIIPAIATTNAIISGLSCLGGTQYFEYLSTTPDGAAIKAGKTDYTQVADSSKVAYIAIAPNKFLSAGKPAPSRPNCPSTALLSRGVLDISDDDYHKQSLGWFADELVKHYGYSRDGISISIGSKLVYDVDFDDKVDDALDTVPSFAPGQIVLVQDDDDELENLELYITGGAASTKFPELKLRAKQTPPAASDASPAAESNGDTVVIDDDEGDLVMVEVEDVEEEPPRKKQRT